MDSSKAFLFRIRSNIWKILFIYIILFILFYIGHVNMQTESYIYFCQQEIGLLCST